MYTERRYQLMRFLEQRGIDDANVLEAMNQVKRELFIPASLAARAYDDNALPIDCNQTISQPYTVAFMTSKLNVKPEDKVLEIGTGSGYQAAVLFYLGAKVFSIERIPELYEKTRKLLKELGIQVNVKLGDGSIGWSEYAPYNGIIVTAAAPKIPTKLKEQLAIGGRLVVPVGDKDYQTMYTITRIDEENYTEKAEDTFKFVPLIGKEGWKEKE